MNRNPKTPTKADNKFVVIVNQLKYDWGLQLPIGDGEIPWSPSQSERTDEVKILRSMRYLFYRDRKAFDYAITYFEEQARIIMSNWKFKPRADLDVIPSRISSKSALSENNFIVGRDLNETAVPEITARLLHIVTNVAELVKVGKDYMTKTETDGAVSRISHATVPDGESRKSTSILHETKLPKSKLSKASQQLTLSKFGFGTKETITKQDLPSSDEYNCDQDTTAILEDVSLACISPFDNIRSNTIRKDSRPTVKPEYSRRSTESFETAPSTPFIPYASIREPVTKTKQYGSDVRLKESLAQTGSFATSGLRNTPRKRTRPEPAVPPMPCKISREGTMRQVLGSKSSLQASSVSSAARSFESTTSVSSSTVSSSTAQTTPNTSFTADSMGTSLNSNGGSFSKNSTSFTSEMCLDFEAKLGNADAHQATLDAMDMDLDPINPSSTGHHVFNDAKVADKSMGPPTSFGRLNAGGGKAPGYEPSGDERLKTIENAGQGMSGRSTMIKYSDKALFLDSPFAYLTSDMNSTLSFRQAYEVNRVAKHCNIPLEHISSKLKANINDYGILWSLLASQTSKDRKSLPEKSSIEAWTQAGLMPDRVAFTGKISYLDRPKGPLLDFQLGPLKLDSSYRLSRKFGNDRLFIIDIPGITQALVPSHLRQDVSTVSDVFIKWLVNREHSFLGRNWRAFYIKPIVNRSEKGNQGLVNASKHRVYLFAVNGYSFGARDQSDETSGHIARPVEDLIDWFMQASQNQQQSSLKFFARLNLGVSKTKPTLTFKPVQIIRSDDAFADNPCVRKLVFKRSDDKKTGRDNVESDVPVMNDGCARISKTAAMDIAQKLGLEGYSPCVYQGRIGGAKGMWMIDALGENVPHNDPDYWIEVTDSQLKFEPHRSDGLFPDPARVTFEVNAWSKPLSQACLNFQLIPILTAQGVKEEVFMHLLEQDLTAKVSELQAAMENGLSLRLWNQDNNSTIGERTQTGKIEMLGGLPKSLGEKINWFVEHGFEPKACRYLKDLLYKAISDYCTRLESRINIGIGRSTTAFMIADPLAVLEEGEVHLGFSTDFRDSKSGFNETMLNDIDVLVARSPAHLPSDIQKVRAVFKPKLGIYKDVIVFSSRGNGPLAAKLSGGDYDGDRAWICWEPELVQPFTNAQVPKAPKVEDYGIKKDDRKVSDFLSTLGKLDTDAFLYHAFDFNMRINMLGSCTSYYAALCYKHYPIRDFPHSHDLAYLLGYLVDSAKGGLRFDEQAWNALRAKWKLPEVPKPAYKDARAARPTKHVIDRLVFETAKGVKDKALKSFADRFRDVGKWDEDLARVWKIEKEDSERTRLLTAVLTDLLQRLASINKHWTKNSSNADDDGRSKGTVTVFHALVEKCREDFLELQPLDCACSRAQLWRRDGHDGHWGLLKASALFFKYSAGSFAWYVAGVELGEIKARARRRGGYQCIVSNIHEAMKIDRKVVKGSIWKEKKEEDLEEDDDDDYGSLFDFADLDDLG